MRTVAIAGYDDLNVRLPRPHLCGVAAITDLLPSYHVFVLRE